MFDPLPIVEEAAAYGCHAPSEPSAARRLPPWLKRNIPSGFGHHATARLLDELELETVCQSARCPNRGECWSQKTATFMILGDTCTRPCGFCSVNKGKTQPLTEDEPQRVAQAAERLNLSHVVITSVTRDDLPDGGAEHFARCVQAVRSRIAATIEVLTPDFVHCRDALTQVVRAQPDVFNHHTETVPRLYREVRGRKSDYRWTLELLRRVKSMNPRIKTKSGLILGLGETHQEILDTLADLVDAGCDFLTLGQYLQPTRQHLSVQRYVRLEEFDQLGRQARQMGFADVASGPFVRGSYRAREMLVGNEQAS